MNKKELEKEVKTLKEEKKHLQEMYSKASDSINKARKKLEKSDLVTLFDHITTGQLVIYIPTTKKKWPKTFHEMWNILKNKTVKKIEINHQEQNKVRLKNTWIHKHRKIICKEREVFGTTKNIITQETFHDYNEIILYVEDKEDIYL